MGLAIPALRFIIREHKRQPFTGTILTLGRQCVYATYDELQRLFQAEGIHPHPLPASMPRTTNIPNWQQGPQQDYTSDEVFFTALTGQLPKTLDVSDYEGAELIWDLNKPVPPSWENMFGAIFDFGTLEHLFDTKEALYNINRMLKVGGRVIHMLPSSNYTEHGFYSFSPTFFYDYYGTNKYGDLRCYIAEQSAWRTDHGPWNIWQWDRQRPSISIRSRHQLVTFFCAQKQADSTVDHIPQQGEYQYGGGGRTGPQKLFGWQATLYHRLPRWMIIFIKRLLRQDKTVKPWGLRYRGKL